MCIAPTGKYFRRGLIQEYFRGYYFGGSILGGVFQGGLFVGEYFGVRVFWGVGVFRVDSFRGNCFRGGLIWGEYFGETISGREFHGESHSGAV